jgi:tRNA dimethylallyltransferase
MCKTSYMKKPRIIVILGPTATGKSDLAVLVAKKLNGLQHGRTTFGQGEIISADSRQVYKGLDIGTGKITAREMQGIPHHLLDVANPKKVFTVDEWKKLTEKAIGEIIARGNTPIIVGGTGFYIQSIVDNIVLPHVPPNTALRKKLEKKSVEELFATLKQIDPARAKSITKEQGNKNPVRLIRAIEIATALGKVPKIKKQKSQYDFVHIGLTSSPEILKEKIHTRLLARLKKGMVAEAQKLYSDGLSYKRMRSLGLEYGALADLLEKNITKQELISRLDREIVQYAKRQMTWFKRDKRIHWFDATDTDKLL